MKILKNQKNIVFDNFIVRLSDSLIHILFTLIYILVLILTFTDFNQHVLNKCSLFVQ